MNQPVGAIVSAIMPVHNGLATLDRAVLSVLAQGFQNWELVVVDDGSDDVTPELLEKWRRADGRVRVIRTEENRGPSAAHNVALRQAAGELVAYLDCDDEFYPDYLGSVNHYAAKGDVLIFGYDIVDDRDPGRPVRPWAPAPFREILFATNLATPLGVAHRRDLALRVGGFDEELWALEDWDLWRRMAREGAEFVFPPLRSGIYHRRETSRSRSPRLTEGQRSAFLCRAKSAPSLYSGPVAKSRVIHRVLLLAPCFPFIWQESSQFANAAQLLSRAGYACQAFCPSKTSVDREGDFQGVLSAVGLDFQTNETRLGPHSVRMIYSRVGLIPVSVFGTRSSRPGEYSAEETPAILDYLEKFLLTFRPDAAMVLNPSGTPDLVFHAMFQVCKGYDLPTVLWLDDESTVNLVALQNVDYCVVTTEHLRRRYWDGLGLLCQVMPPVLDWTRGEGGAPEHGAVTVGSAASPGERLFARRVAERLGRLRPDIPVACDGVRSSADGYTGPASGVGTHGDATAGGSSGAGRQVDGIRVLVVPSLGRSSHDRRIAQAMVSGIPVVVSDRGPLPEIVGDAGTVLNIPLRYQPQLSEEPFADDVSPWVDAIVRLWGDQRLYAEVSARTVEHAQQWHPDRVTPIYVEFFRNLRPQPGPPMVPRWSDKSEFPYYPSS